MSISLSFPRTRLKFLLRLPAPLRCFTTSSTFQASRIAEEIQAQNEELSKNQKAPQGKENKMPGPGAGSNLDYSGEKKKKAAPAIPRPSSSVILISPQNQILLLQRVKQSSSFPSAHVFPGGNVSEYHDGRAPEPETKERHEDGEAYRNAAIRETFEESGILLARNAGFGRLIEVPEAERESGRRQVHGNKVPFREWLAKKGGRADVEGLTPFTRWITPTNVPKRFTTQMYLYFLPTLGGTGLEGGESEEEVQIPDPSTDGGKEHTTARFLPASAWCRLAQEGRIILFPPQFFLLHQIAQHLDSLASPTGYGSISRQPLPREELERRRKALLEFVKGGTPPWMEKCISPSVLPPRDGKKRDDGRNVLGLNRPGPELEAMKAGRAGVSEECVLVEFKKEGPRRLAVISREEALAGGVKL